MAMSTVQLLEHEGFKNVEHDMSDVHAHYYFGDTEKAQYEIKRTMDGDFYGRRVGNEDWHYMFHEEELEVTN